ncbi:MAG: hypothetical protein KVP17_000184 [Porospora cf. gigantea B]|uniref:uncharacterized protein n=1 Tax=Porospora cf. gigantea B TaxID=2853592 RepID=UPI003571DD06|nr:MAG: hypothetical protein KVP17_000184 [Porospora cf. gigantea B]
MASRPIRSGGVYVPPHKLQTLFEDQLRKSASDPIQRQRLEWEALRKSINGLVNKASRSNVAEVTVELFRENLIRGRALLVRTVLKAQLSSPEFTPIFAAMIAIINSKLPEVGKLLIERLILQFRRAYRRNDKILTKACVAFIAHLVNQRVAHEIIALQLIALLLERPTDDSVEVCVNFMLEVGQVLEEVSVQAYRSVVERLRAIQREGTCEVKVLYAIDRIFDAMRKRFVDYPGLPDDLDLVDEDDQISHALDLLDPNLQPDESLHVFRETDPEVYAAESARWKEISMEILGEAESDDSEDGASSEDSEDDPATTMIVDFTEEQMIQLRKAVYLVFRSAANFEEGVHKLMQMNIQAGQVMEVCRMLIDCTAMEKVFQKYYSLMAERLCCIRPEYEQCFEQCFGSCYNTVHRLDSNKLRNTAKFFAHLLFTDAIPWTVLSHFQLTEQTTTSAGRIFIKVLFQEIAQEMGIVKLKTRIEEPVLQEFLVGLFPTDEPKNSRFAVNFFRAIGLGVLTDQLAEAMTRAVKG